MKNLLSKIWPLLVILSVVFVFFWKVFLLGQAPIPGDFIVGTYFPWLDYKWGYEVGVPVKNAVTSDVVSITYPLRSYVADQIKSGHLPLWNPFMFNGSPLLADFQVGIFSPTMIFYFFLPKIWAWTSQIMMQPILAAIFTYLLLRNFGLKKMESIFGGLFYAFSSFNIVWMEWNTNTLAAAFIPLLILFLNKLINTQRMYWGVLLAIGICLQIFAGYPQIVIFTLAALLMFAVFNYRKITKGTIFQILLFIGVGASLSAILLFPGSEFVLNSQRKFGFLTHDLIYFPWKSLITILAPDYFGNPATGNYFGDGNYTINVLYSGVVVLLFALTGAMNDWKKKEVKYFVLLFLLALIFALPTIFAKALFYSPIPGISMSSNTRILVLANLSLAVLAGFGISNLLSSERLKKLGVVFVPLVILVAILTLTYFAGERSDVSMRNLVLPIGLALMSAVLIILRNKLYKAKLVRISLVFVLCLAATLELFRYGWKYTPFSHPDLVFPNTPVLDFFKGEREPFRVSTGDVIPMNMWVPYGLESTSGYDAMYPIWWARLFSAISSNDPRFSELGYYAQFEKYESRWFDLLNNKYLMVLNPEKKSDDPGKVRLVDKIQKDTDFEKVFQDKSVAIFRNKNVFPRAFLVSNWENKSGEASLSRLIDPDFLPHKSVIVESDLNISAPDVTNSKVSYELYSSEKSIINVESDGGGILVVMDAWYPGWKVRVDGKENQLYRADYAFRAVAVSEGLHKVEFMYDPTSLKIGKLISLITLVMLVGFVLFDLKVNEKSLSK